MEGSRPPGRVYLVCGTGQAVPLIGSRHSLRISNTGRSAYRFLAVCAARQHSIDVYLVHLTAAPLKFHSASEPWYCE